MGWGFLGTPDGPVWTSARPQLGLLMDGMIEYRHDPSCVIRSVPVFRVYSCVGDDPRSFTC